MKVMIDSDTVKDDFRREFSLLKESSHEHVVKYFDHFYDLNCFCIITEFCEVK